MVELKKVFRFLGVKEINFKVEELPRFNVNHEMDDEMLSDKAIPARTLDFIASDMEEFQTYIGRDLLNVWPSLNYLK